VTRREPERAPVGVPGVDDVLSAPGVPLTVPQGLPEVTPVAEAVAVGFAEFYRRERDGVARALSLTLGDVDLGAEAADEAMARAYQRWATVGRMESPGGWVFRVGLNWSRSWLRRRGRAPVPLFDPGPAEHQAAEPDVLVALAELDLAQRSVVVLRLYLGLSEAQTAATLRIPAGTVKSRLHRATRTLQVRLGHQRTSDEDDESPTTWSTTDERPRPEARRPGRVPPRAGG
jgi:DNA-directed RNA polymerase specialized sigma24 family protein